MASGSGKGVGLGNMQSFYKTGNVGTDSAQTIPHGQGYAPAVVIVQPDDPSTTTITSISSDKDNITLTATAAKTFTVLALWDKR